VPPETAIEFVEGASLREPELVYLPDVRRTGPPACESSDQHFGKINEIAIGLPETTLSVAAKSIAVSGLVRYFTAQQFLLELSVESNRDFCIDFRPDSLPLVLRSSFENGENQW
jgi:hypothetical protein